MSIATFIFRAFAAAGRNLADTWRNNGEWLHTPFTVTNHHRHHARRP